MSLPRYACIKKKHICARSDDKLRRSKVVGTVVNYKVARASVHRNWRQIVSDRSVEVGQLDPIPVSKHE